MSLINFMEFIILIFSLISFSLITEFSVVYSCHKVEYPKQFQKYCFSNTTYFDYVPADTKINLYFLSSVCITTVIMSGIVIYKKRFENNYVNDIDVRPENEENLL